MTHVITFHGIGTTTRPLSDAESQCWISKQFFVDILNMISNRGSSKDVEITFDDGNASDLHIAAPHLTEKNLSARFFVSTSEIGSRGYLSRQDVHELLKLGMSVGTHGHHHTDWRLLDRIDLEREIENSRVILSGIIGAPVEEAAVPFGAYNRKVIRALRKAGFSRVYTSDGGTCRADAWLKPRTSIRNGMSVQDVEHLISQESRYLERLSRNVKMLIKKTV